MKIATRTAHSRPYRLQVRAEGAERRAERVMDAAIALWRERWFDELTLQDIAERSGVSMSTIMRRFGSKEGIVAAVLATDRVGTFGARDRVATGDVDAALTELVDDYERVGDAVIRNLALEERIPAIGHAVKTGRTMHREFVARVFSPWLPRRRGPAYERRLAQLIVVCDVYTWKLLRRDHGLSKADTMRAMRELLQRLIEEQ